MTAGSGILHFGPGAFHRAHQADYVNRLLVDDPRWGIAAISLRSGATIEALARQQGRYTLAILDAEPDYRTIRAHTAWHGPGEERAVRACLADPKTRIVTSTVTEKGYCLGPDGVLDLAHPDIVDDLAAPETPRSLVGWLALGLTDRRAAGNPPFTALCCDNMASNGRKLGAAVQAFAEARDAELGLRVQRITPEAARRLGLSSPKGVLVVEVQPGSPADLVGIEPADVIREVNQRAVTNVKDFERATRQGRRGDRILLLVQRGDNAVFFAVKRKG